MQETTYASASLPSDRRHLCSFVGILFPATKPKHSKPGMPPLTENGWTWEFLKQEKKASPRLAVLYL